LKNTLYSLFVIAGCLSLGKVIAANFGGLPASLYGMIIFTSVLHFQLANPEKISATISWIIQHMGVCFVPAGVGIINHYQLIREYGFTLVVIIFISTFILLSFVGLSYQHLVLNKNSNSG
jgi:holin-like protein|tara:strand:+ start:638 stop:997 length:360 start_codon:yes stop_codon:yes gene_type:complete